MSSTDHTSGNSEQAEARSTLADGTSLRLTVAGTKAHLKAQRAMAAAEWALRTPELERLEPIGEDDSYAGIVGRSPAMQSLFHLLRKLQRTDATVLITGENGTGKELVARAVHELSPRANRSFVATNCSAFNDNLLESELFGHKRGAFTGAVGDKPGLFQVADGGTFFMDEVGDMSPALQVKLLRVLQEGVFTPVGSTEPKRVDVRIVAATNRHLHDMVEQGTFRQDLYYRLHVVALHVPPLRERATDIPLLVAHFMDRLSRRDGRRKDLAPETMAKLVSHRWPGNVRELENEMERLWVLSGDVDVIGPEHLTPTIREVTPSPVQTQQAAALSPYESLWSTGAPSSAPLSASDEGTELPSHRDPRTGRPSTQALSMFDAELASGTWDKVPLPRAVESLERRLIERALAKHGGNKTRTAETLGISRRNLIRKVQAYAEADAAEARALGSMTAVTEPPSGHDL